jgi:predicted metal-dependent hydrolase
VETLLFPRLHQHSKLNGFRYEDIRAKQLTSRWGSCDTNGVISLSIYLAQLPWDLIDYVILHELTHTRHMNHGPEFWRTMESLVPDAKKKRKAIKQFRPTLIVE